MNYEEEEEEEEEMEKDQEKQHIHEKGKRRRNEGHFGSYSAASGTPYSSLKRHFILQGRVQHTE